MKHLFFIVAFTLFLHNTLIAQQTDSAQYIPPNPIQKFENPVFKGMNSKDLVSLSLVSPTLYDNWEQQLKIFKKKYAKQNALLLVSKKDSRQRAEFVKEFMLQRTAGKELLVAYAETLRLLTIKYTNLNFKYYLHLKK